MTSFYLVAKLILFVCVCVLVCTPACVRLFLCSAPAVINSKILTVTVRPEPQPSEPMVMVELSPIINVSERKEKASACGLEDVTRDEN